MPVFATQPARRVVQFLTGLSPDGNPPNYELVQCRSGWELRWFAAGQPPTQKDIDQAIAGAKLVDGQTYAQWILEYGGDATLTSRRNARERFNDKEGLAHLLRAYIVEQNRRDNQVAQQLDALRDALAKANDLPDAKAAAAAIPDALSITANQLRNRLLNAIGAGDGDN